LTYLAKFRIATIQISRRILEKHSVLCGHDHDIIFCSRLRSVAHDMLFTSVLDISEGRTSINTHAYAYLSPETTFTERFAEDILYKFVTQPECVAFVVRLNQNTQVPAL